MGIGGVSPPRAGRGCFVIIVKKVGFIFVLRAEMLHFY